LANAFEEADLRLGLKQGGTVLGSFIVELPDCAGFVVYMRTDWIRGRGFRIVQTWRGRGGERTFRSLDVALRFIRKYGFAGKITIYPAGDRDLFQFAGLRREDSPRRNRSAGTDAATE
jgi:hypothetical protein